MFYGQSICCLYSICMEPHPCNASLVLTYGLTQFSWTQMMSLHFWTMSFWLLTPIECMFEYLGSWRTHLMFSRKISQCVCNAYKHFVKIQGVSLFFICYVQLISTTRCMQYVHRILTVSTRCITNIFTQVCKLNLFHSLTISKSKLQHICWNISPCCSGYP